MVRSWNYIKLLFSNAKLVFPKTKLLFLFKYLSSLNLTLIPVVVLVFELLYHDIV